MEQQKYHFDGRVVKHAVLYYIPIAQYLIWYVHWILQLIQLDIQNTFVRKKGLQSGLIQHYYC